MHCSRRAGKPKIRKYILNLYTSTPMLFDESPMLFDESPMLFDESPMLFDERPMLFDELVSPLFMVQVLLKQQNYIIQTLHIFIIHTFISAYILYITSYIQYIYNIFQVLHFLSESTVWIQKKVPDKPTLNPPICAFHQTTASARRFLSPPYQLVLVNKSIRKIP